MSRPFLTRKQLSNLLRFLHIIHVPLDKWLLQNGASPSTLKQMEKRIDFVHWGRIMNIIFS